MNTAVTMGLAATGRMPDLKTSPLVIFTVGTAASGKSTWARSMQSRYTGLRIAIIERDGIRVSLHEGKSEGVFSWPAWNPALEGKVQRLWEQQVRGAIGTHDVLVLADTHLDVADLAKKAQWLRDQGVTEMSVHYFPALPLMELIRRDRGRGHPVGGEVLREHIKKLEPEDRYW
ncbi:MAG: AAA family ATPase [Acidithiobacillus sp.]